MSDNEVYIVFSMKFGKGLVPTHFFPSLEEAKDEVKGRKFGFEIRVCPGWNGWGKVPDIRNTKRIPVYGL